MFALAMSFALVVASFSLDQCLENSDLVEILDQKPSGYDQNQAYLEGQTKRVQTELQALGASSFAGAEWAPEARQILKGIREQALADLHLATQLLARLEAEQLPVLPIHNYLGLHPFIGAARMSLELHSFIEDRSQHQKSDARAVELKTSLELLKNVGEDEKIEPEVLALIESNLFDRRSIAAFLYGEEAESREKKIQEIYEAHKRIFRIRSPQIESYQPASYNSDPNQYFDPEKYPVEAKFLTEVRAKPLAQNEALPESVDLSSVFSRPRHQCVDTTPGQERRSYACVSFSVVSDMETLPDVPVLSASDLYSLGIANQVFLQRMDERLASFIQAEWQKIEAQVVNEDWDQEKVDQEILKRVQADPGMMRLYERLSGSYAELASIPLPDNSLAYIQQILSPEDFMKYEQGIFSGTAPPVSMEIAKLHPIPTEQNHPWPRWLPADRRSIPGPRYRLTAFASTQDRATDYTQLETKGFPKGVKDLNFYKLLLSQGIHLQISYGTDARLRLEDWLYPRPNEEIESGEAKFGGHIMNIVGYGQALDPLHMQMTDYFIVRDSFEIDPIHYRVPASELLDYAQFVHKVLGVEKVDP